jgi:hypothetical protein
MTEFVRPGPLGTHSTEEETRDWSWASLMCLTFAKLKLVPARRG